MQIKETKLATFPEVQLAKSSPPDEAPEKAKSAAKFEMVVSDEKPEGFEDPAPASRDRPENARMRAERLRHEELERKKQEFIDKVREARRVQDLPAPKPQPVSPAIQARINAEIEAGRKAAEAHKAQRGQELARPADPREGITVPVLRPQSYTHEKNTAKSVPVS